MTYSINELAALAGISARTLRYYDQIGLLTPGRQQDNAYRVYGQKEVDRLQQILFYRELGFSLTEVKQMIEADDYDSLKALQDHLLVLKEKQAQTGLLITNVEKTIASLKGELTMSDEEKFEGFKQQLINDNEKQYGKEIREKYGDDVVDQSNAKLKGLTARQYEQAQELSNQLNVYLKKAVEQGQPDSELAQKTCALHKEWLGYYWPQYSKEAHLGLAQMYVDDPRFKAYYEAIAPGGAEFLRDALKIYCS
ncbi:MerR family transcriptional regulator [Sporolactobacillus spathodeae]|uniref:DNA-binding transcriptional MerR regulator n=1 Tax=Sporolactobacillus spathodeae TaxID=1465502 RepID=A0ABS2Q7D7_9BACL|nr:MerR family transcriptional regulator [Sporolactobacillus spathodeae]MBM7657704.1 DNA-binding transcriptional MerR regulator [Sporolactobacillus spathodeae]